MKLYVHRSDEKNMAVIHSLTLFTNAATQYSEDMTPGIDSYFIFTCQMFWNFLQLNDTFCITEQWIQIIDYTIVNKLTMLQKQFTLLST